MAAIGLSAPVTLCKSDALLVLIIPAWLVYDWGSGGRRLNLARMAVQGLSAPDPAHRYSESLFRILLLSQRCYVFPMQSFSLQSQPLLVCSFSSVVCGLGIPSSPHTSRRPNMAGAGLGGSVGRVNSLSVRVSRALCLATQFFVTAAHDLFRHPEMPFRHPPYPAPLATH